MKLSDKLDRIRAATPKRSRFGQLYARKTETTKRFKKITLYTLFLSEEATHLLRNHVFSSAEPKTGRQWSQWFAEKVSETDGHVHDDPSENTMGRLAYIHKYAVLPGIAVRTSKTWAVREIIGWVGGVRAKSKSDNSKVDRKRHPPKQSR